MKQPLRPPCLADRWHQQVAVYAQAAMIGACRRARQKGVHG